MTRKLIVIKFGGSVITDKNSATPKPNLKVINNLSTQIKDLFETKKYDFILVHGAGSFGHPIAKKYSLHLGMKTDQQKLAFSKIQQIMLDLNKIFMEQLIKQNLPVVNFIPHSFVSQTAGVFKEMDTELIKKSLETNQIPVLYGDAVLDDQWGCSILSGDIIVAYLAQKLNADKVVFLSDVDGIFTENPKINPQAKRISLISNQNLDQVLMNLLSNNKHDVTGEMKGKILSIQKLLTNKEVLIISGLVTDNLDQAIRGTNQIGTKLQFD